MVVQENKLQHLDESMFQNLKLLEKLDVQLNEISSVSLATKFDNSIATLNLDYNRIERVDELSFSALSSLSQLTLASNMISKIEPSSFDSNQKLERVDLSVNESNQVLLKAWRNSNRWS